MKIMLRKAYLTSAYGKLGLIFLIMLIVGAFHLLSMAFFTFSTGRNLLYSNLHDDVEVEKDELLPMGFDEKSCLSRHHSLLNPRRRGVARKASPRLISKLRSYEARHKRCGPHTGPYNKTVELLMNRGLARASHHDYCNYLVWMPMHGLGNRILALASSFLYALLTDRILLLDRQISDHDLFCEPFPHTSWLLPLDFPLASHLRGLRADSPLCYGELLRNSTFFTASASSPPLPYIYLNIHTGSSDLDKQFFCDKDQAYLRTIPWLVIRSNTYFIPSLFSMPLFKEELHTLFPEKEIVFHLLGRYLVHPTNSVWGLITRFYQSYLSTADETVGVQVRVFSDSSPALVNHLFQQIVACMTKENILADVKVGKEGRLREIEQVKKEKKKKRVGVLITSLTWEYYQQVRDMYYENPTGNGDVIGVFQASNEKVEDNEKGDQNRKAWAEMYLLSLMDKLVTSSSSTFGYVAQGLGGLRPWILQLPNNHTTPDPPCRQGISMEPCYHVAPNPTCKSTIHSSPPLPYVGPCEDRFWDIKLLPN